MGQIGAGGGEKELPSLPLLFPSLFNPPPTSFLFLTSFNYLFPPFMPIFPSSEHLSTSPGTTRLSAPPLCPLCCSHMLYFLFPPLFFVIFFCIQK